MADQKISQLTSATTPLAGTEVVPIVQNGSTKKVALGSIATQAASSVSITGGSITGLSSLSASADASVNGLTVGRGSGSVGTNTAVGASALGVNTTGSQNTANGNAALSANTSGNYCTAVGYYAGVSVNADLNTYIGWRCGDIATTGGSNVGVGANALDNLTTGSGNVAVGYVSGGDAVANITTQSNYAVFGNNSTTNAYVKVAWTVTSDARDKTNIVPVPLGLDFVSKLNPVSYQFTDNRTDKNAVGDVRYGFLAQDILALEGDVPVIIDNKDADNLKYNGESLTPILVAAIKELNAKVESQAAEIALLKGN